jgi:hypothetical protein
MTDIISFEPVVARDANGNPVANAQATFFQTGTTTPVTVYTTAAESTAHPSPLVADGNGVFPAVFKSGAAVKVVVKTPLGATLYTLDPAIKVASSGSAAGSISFAPTDDIPVTSVQDAIERVQTNMEGDVATVKALSAGATAPASPVANMLWYDTATNFLNKRNEANSAWDKVLFISSSGLVRLLDGTGIVQSDGTALMAFLKAVAQSVWDTGTSNEDVLISPAKLTAAIATHAGIGFNPSPTRTDITGSVSDLTERKNTSSYLMEITIETLNAGTVQVSDDDG